MSDFAGTRALVRFNLRRDRIVLPAFVLVIATVMSIGVSSLEELYPTRADRQALAVTIGDNPAISAIRGAPHDLESLGGLVAFQTGVTYSVIVAIFSLLLLGRHARADEEAGRTELVLSTSTGRRAPIAAALIVVVGADLVLAVAVAVGLAASGLAAGGSIALGLWLGTVGAFFAAFAALAAQLTESARAATGISLAALGASYSLRAAGDAGDGTLTWLSPIGWAEQTRPFAGERWWPLLLLAAATALAVALAYRLLARRDHQAGILPPRAGPAVGSPSLGRPLGLALRLQRGSLVAWGAGLFLLGLVYGSVTDGIESLVEDNEQLADVLAKAGGASVVDSFFVSAISILALIGTGFAISSALRPRGEETAGRSEAVLATALSRRRWAGGHLAVAIGGAVALLAVAGVGMGLGAAVSTGDAGEFPRVAAAALVPVPAVWVLIGLAVATFGLYPRAVGLAWGALALCVFLGLFGVLLGVPGWLMDLSPYNHVPEVPVDELSAGPLLALSGVAAALMGAGLAGLSRRDVA